MIGDHGISLSKWVHNVSGAIFCDVISRSPAHKGSRPTTAGNQKWAGAAPSLMVRPINIVAVVSWADGLMISRAVNVGPIRKRIDPVTCARK